MDAQTIRYFGTDVAYGEDCQPLSPDQTVVANMKHGGPVTVLAGDLDLMGLNRRNYQVSYTHQRS